MNSNNTTPLTAEEEQFIRDTGDDGNGLSRYPAYSSPVTASDLLQKLTDQFNAVPSYTERFANGSASTENE
jgi:hypothetical protein